MTSVPGRRTYTEEELQNALQDILSGKLGTRRAAVLYGIPRSTLRNKVYKLAMEQKHREALNTQPALDQDEDEKEMSEDEKDLDRTNQNMSLTPEEIIKSSKHSSTTGTGVHNIVKQENCSSRTHEQPKNLHLPRCSQPQTSPIPPNPWMSMDPNVILQSLLLTGGLGAALPGLMQSKPEEIAALPEMLKNFMIQQQELIKEQIKNSVATNEHNGKPNNDSRLFMQNFPFIQQQQQQQQQLLRAMQSSDTSETAVDSSELNDGEDPVMILKIPSYKGSTSGKNNDSVNSPQSQNSTTILSRSPLQSHLSEISPSLRQNNESQSPPAKSVLSFGEVIANSISKNFQQHESINKHHSNNMDQLDQYKRPSISVIKNLGGADMSRFGSCQNLVNVGSNSQSSTGTGGKGTRPKRGKYRNYDRDSLVEAVKAVQRGEMSVHRAGSYYGVPHSTLEYKVKERHLMRPRKREPKPQPVDDRTAIPSSSSSNVKSGDSAGNSASVNLRNLEKSKNLPTTKSPMKTPPFPETSPNGLKMSNIFDPAQLQYTSPLFWPHPNSFAGLPMDFTRNPSATSTFPPNADSFFASQMMQKIQEDSSRQSVSTSKSTVSNNQSQNQRDLGEHFYEGAANGSILDGIIRHTLEKKPNEINLHGALLDQLKKGNRINPNLDDNSNNGIKRGGSPLNFSNTDFKKERLSPETVKDISDISKETVNSLNNLRESVAFRIDKNAIIHNSTEDLNGSTSDENLKISNTDDEDSS